MDRLRSNQFEDPDYDPYRTPSLDVGGLSAAGLRGAHRFPVDPGPPPPRIRISMKRLASGAWQPEFTVESFDADPTTDEGYDLIKRRLEDTASLIRERIALFARIDAEEAS